MVDASDKAEALEHILQVQGADVLRFLDDSDRVFLVDTDLAGAIRAASGSFQRVLSTPTSVEGRSILNLLLSSRPGTPRLSIDDVRFCSSPCLVKLAETNRPCRLFPFFRDDGILFLGELVGGSASADLEEMSGLMAQVQALLQEVKHKSDLLKRDLEAAALVQQRLLPTRRSFSGVHCEWAFRPWAKVGGDLFNLAPIGNGLLASYILDVTGHGVPAAMVGTAVAHLLQPGTGLLTGMDEAPADPRDVLLRLEREFPFNRYELPFTVLLFLLDLTTGQLQISNAGHPSPIVQPREGEARVLDVGGALIGFTNEARIERRPPEAHRLGPGDRLFYFTDGLTEFRDPSGEPYGPDRLASKLGELHGLPLSDVIAKAIEDAEAFAHPKPAQDDITLVGIQFGERDSLMSQGP